MDEEAIFINDEPIMHKLVRIPGDGACLFSSLCYLMHDEVNICMVDRIRAEIVAHIHNNWSTFHLYTQLQSGDPYPNVQEYMKDMTRRYTYGSLAELMAAGELYQYEFQVYQNGQLRATFGDPVKGVKRIKFTGHFNKGHFDVLIPLNLTLTQEAQIPPIPIEHENNVANLIEPPINPSKDILNRNDFNRKILNVLQTQNQDQNQKKKRNKKQSHRNKCFAKKKAHNNFRTTVETPKDKSVRNQKNKENMRNFRGKIDKRKRLNRVQANKKILMDKVKIPEQSNKIKNKINGLDSPIPEISNVLQTQVATNQHQNQKKKRNKKQSHRKKCLKKKKAQSNFRNTVVTQEAQISPIQMEYENDIADLIELEPTINPSKDILNGSDPNQEISKVLQTQVVTNQNQRKKRNKNQSHRKKCLTKKKAQSKFRNTIETPEDKYIRNQNNKENMSIFRDEVETPQKKRKRLVDKEICRNEIETTEQLNQIKNKINEQCYKNANKGKGSYVKENSAYSYNPNLNYENDVMVSIGNMNIVCRFCKALKWKVEAPGICCLNGKIALPALTAPPEPLKQLLTDNSPEAKHFQDNIRSYNHCFQMTSFGTSKKVQEEGYMPSFKIQGQVYHLIGSLLPDDNEDPKFVQIYFVSDLHEQAITRKKYHPVTRIELILQLQEMLHYHNKYVKDFKFAAETLSPEYQIVIDADKVPDGEHERRFNVPTTSEIAIILVGEKHEKRDIILQLKSGTLQRIAETHRSYDALQYPLMMWQGDDGYHFQLYQQNPETGHKTSKRISAMDFYSFRFMMRVDDFNLILHYKSLLLQFSVDMYAKIEAERLRYIRLNQKKLRVDEYAHLKDSMNHDGNTENLGRLVILPSSFTGSPRYMQERTQDAITYVRNYGRPNIFITFTCNPKWDDITKNLFPGQRPHDRHDLIARVFHIKVKSLMNVIVKGKIFGSVRCYMFTVEWQKRGLPHVHILIWMKEKKHMDDVDSFISAELPNSETDPELHRIVKSHMIHGPCGPLNPRSPCMKDGKCQKKYPRKILKETQCGNDGYPMYRRRGPDDGGFSAKIKAHGKEVDIDNRWVVPYSPILSRMFDSHINIEFCASVKSIKYVCKYINKGSDMAVFHLKDSEKPQNINDEVLCYELGRYISTNEAFWRIFNFTLHEHYPPVIHLSVHLENGQRVYFTEGHVEERLEKSNESTLTGFFSLCKSDEFAKELYYHEVPKFYTWDKTNKKWQRRKIGHAHHKHPGVKGTDTLGRVYTVHPLHSECFFLRLLLHEVKGPTSFEDLKRHGDTICETYRQACQLRGLLEDDAHWDKTLEEASAGDSPKSLRNLFALMLHVCGISSPLALWEKYKKNMAEDILHETNKLDHNLVLDFTDEIFNKTLVIIENKLRDLGSMSIKTFGLPCPNREITSEICVEIIRETSYDENELMSFILENEVKLNTEQRLVYEKITNIVFSRHNQDQMFFLDAPGGTGKTFLLNIILAKVRLQKKIAIAAASSGIAATLLHGGRTTHSIFQLPLNLATAESATCNITRGSGKAKLLQNCDLIIWDECTMSHKSALEAVNRTMQDLRQNEDLMGGVTLLLAGDFRQTLPVIPRGTKADELQSCLKSSYLWKKIQLLKLTTNMRAKQTGVAEALCFSKTLLNIGEGKLTEQEFDGAILISSVGGKLVSSEDELKSLVFPKIDMHYKDHNWLSQRSILAPKNDEVHRINNDLLRHIPGQAFIFKSIDSVVKGEDAVNYPIEFLNSIDVSGLPPHELNLKIGAPVMLLRNLDPPVLCNGTRLIIKKVMNNVLEAIVMTGRFKGEEVYIPKIPVIPSDLPFQFRRLQFPIRVCFAMSINKAQGQSMDTVGINLKIPCFSHGQLYVACSRVGDPNNLYILSPSLITKNVVYHEVLK